MSAARDRHPSRYQPPHRVLGRVPDDVAEGIARHEAPDLIAGVEWLLKMSTPFQDQEIAQAPWKEAP